MELRTAAETEERLAKAGFEDVRCWLEERVVEPEDPREFVAVVGLAAHHDRLPAELRQPFTDAVDEELPHPLVLRYVRLNIEARADGSRRAGAAVPYMTSGTGTSRVRRRCRACLA